MATPKIPKVDMDTSEAKNTLDLINIMLTSLHNLGRQYDVGNSNMCWYT